ncbi:MAG: hypothetical protein KGD64_08455 [Candidatus Heimdallarchaeota archaeon]|nr:hypothetical protein [Candidatus Heimdallarchaeota archaeon]
MKRKIVLIIITGLFVSSLAIVQNTVQAAVPECFSIALLSPNTSPARNQWVLLMEQLLPEIGIGISYHESTGWANISLRTWTYPLIEYDYIPTYDEGGYDMLFLGYRLGMDIQLSGLFETNALIPYGDNFYQYTNPVYDAILENYEQEYDPVLRTQYAHLLQAILYEDLPSISILHQNYLYGFKTGLIGINPLLVSIANQRIENWYDPVDRIITHAVPAVLSEPNIFVVANYYDRLWMQNVYGSLFSRNPASLMWEPNIASNCIITNGGTNLTVTIDPNAKFSHGDAVLAEDVKYSYELYMTPDVGSSDYGYLTKWFASNDSIIEHNSSTLSFILTEPYNFPLSLLSYGLLDKSDVEAKIATYGLDIFYEVPLTGDVGASLVKSCGPMMVNNYNPSLSTVQLLPNPYWHGNSVVLDEWNEIFISSKESAVAALIAGTIDIMDAQYSPELADFEGISGVNGVIVQDLSNQEMAVNMRHPILGTGELTPIGTTEAAKFVRKAISHATPRQYIIDTILLGLGEEGISPFPPGCVGFDDSLLPYEYDLDIAISYMEAAGYDLTVIPEFSSGYFILLGFLAVCSSIIFYRKKKKQ